MDRNGGASGDLDLRRRRLHFRAWHRGMREVDLLLGRFVDARLDALDGAELAALEELLDLPDNDLLAWIMDEGQSAPERYAPVLLRIVAFHHAGPDDLNKDR